MTNVSDFTPAGSADNAGSDPLSDRMARGRSERMNEGDGGLGSTAEKAKSFIDNQRNVGADYLHGLAQAVHRAAGQLDQEIPQAAQYIHKAGDHLDSVANDVRHRAPQELLGQLENYARRQPVIFFGGAMLLGFAALRFLKAGQNTQRQEY